ncbi:MAG: hypothetical protein RR490_08130, partial [Niameybacter sp.]
MRKIFPFYTFMRKNTEFHIKNFGKNARRYSQLAEVAKNMYDSQGIDENEVPKYMKESMQIPLGRTEDGKIRYLKFTPSFVEAFQTLTGQNIVSGLNPLLKTPAELAIGTDFFTGQPKDTSLRGILANDVVGSMVPVPQVLSPMAQEGTKKIVDLFTQPKLASENLG